MANVNSPKFSEAPSRIQEAADHLQHTRDHSAGNSAETACCELLRLLEPLNNNLNALYQMLPDCYAANNPTSPSTEWCCDIFGGGSGGSVIHSTTSTGWNIFDCFGGGGSVNTLDPPTIDLCCCCGFGVSG